MDVDYLLRLAAIGLINVALSGDNVIVIGMAAASLPHRQRKAAILGGGALAIILRVVLTIAAAEILELPILSIVGGVVLFWVAWGLLDVDTGSGAPEDEMDPAGSGTGANVHPGHVPVGTAAARTGNTLRGAIQIIVIADITMSLDNVIAVAGSAGGDVGLLIIGLLISMPVLMISGGAVSLLIDRFRWLVYLGAGAICFTGARMIFDAVPRTQLGVVAGVWGLVISVVLAVALPALFHLIRARRSPSVPSEDRG